MLRTQLQLPMRCLQTLSDGFRSVAGKNYDHRKDWIETQLQWFARLFGIEPLAISILSNHYHLVLSARTDVVAA